MPNTGFSSLWSSNRKLSLVFFVIALVCLPFADLIIYQVEPWQELSRMGAGMLSPHFPDWRVLIDALLITVAFALIAVVGAAISGLLLARIYH